MKWRHMVGLLVVCVLASACSNTPTSSLPPDVRHIEALILDGRYDDAETEARALLDAAPLDGDQPLYSVLLGDSMVKCLLRQGRGSEAETLQLVDQVLEVKLRHLSANDVGVAETRMLRGRLLTSIARYPEAEEELARAATIIEERLGGRSAMFAVVRRYQSFLLYHQGRFEKALAAAAEAVEILDELDEPVHTDVTDSLVSLGMIHKKMGDLDAATIDLERALTIQREIYRTDHPELSTTLNNLGNLMRAKGEFEQARELLSEALAIKEVTGGPPSVNLAILKLNLAFAYDKMGASEAATDLTRQALELMEELLPPNHPYVAVALDNYGAMLAAQGNYAAARKPLERSVEIRDVPGIDRTQVAFSLQNLGSLSLLLGDPETAERHFRRAHTEMSEALGADSAEAAEAQTKVARILRQRGRIEEATRLQEEAVAHASSALDPEHATVAAYQVELADLLLAQGDVERAGSLALPALATLRGEFNGDHPHLGDALMVLGRIALSNGDPKAGTRRFLEAAEMRERLQGSGTSRDLIESLQALAAAEWRSGDQADDALLTARRSESLAREFFRSTVGSLAEREALRFAATMNSGLDTMISVEIDRVERNSGHGSRPARETVWDEAVRSRSLILDDLASRREVARASDDPELAEIVEEARDASRRVSHLVTRGPNPDDPERHAVKLKAAIEARDRVERRWGDKSRSFARANRRQRLGLSESLAALPPEAALVAFVRYGRLRITGGESSAPQRLSGLRTESSYVAFVATGAHAEPLMIPLGPAKRIDATIRRFREQLSVDPRARGSAEEAEAEYIRVGSELRKAIWEPLEPPLRGKQLIFVVPDGDVHLISFATLPSVGGGFLLEGPQTFHYLTTEREIVRPGIPVEEELRLLVMGAPDFDTVDEAPRSVVGNRHRSPAPPLGPESVCRELRALRFQPLPGTLGEIDDIDALYNSVERLKGRRVVSRLTGAQATESAFKKRVESHTVVHIATHGFSVAERCAALSGDGRTGSGDGSMRLTGLAFSGANRSLKGAPEPGTEDGLLTAEEIANLDLSRVGWAVLSACGTGTGTVFDGEGVLGLRRAFEVAGARTLIMSLWDVEDEATRFWMRRLHEERLRGAGAPEALREASLAWLSRARTSQSTTHPFYWGAFVAAGDWR